MHTDRLLAHSLLTWMLATGPTRSTCACRGPGSACTCTALKGVLVEENSTVVLGDYVELLRQRTIGDEACPFMHTNQTPRAVEVTCQRARVRPRCGAGGSKIKAVACPWTAVFCDQGVVQVAE